MCVLSPWSLGTAGVACLVKPAAMPASPKLSCCEVACIQHLAVPGPTDPGSMCIVSHVHPHLLQAPSCRPCRYLAHAQALLKDGTEVPPCVLHLRSLSIQGLPHSCRNSCISVHMAARPSGSACVQPVATFTSGEGVVLNQLCGAACWISWSS